MLKYAFFVAKLAKITLFVSPVRFESADINDAQLPISLGVLCPKLDCSYLGHSKSLSLPCGIHNEKDEQFQPFCKHPCK